MKDKVWRNSSDRDITSLLKGNQSSLRPLHFVYLCIANAIFNWDSEGYLLYYP